MNTVSEEQVLFNKLNWENQQMILRIMKCFQPCEIAPNEENNDKIEPLKTLRHSCNFDRHEETLYENEVDLARKITELIDKVNNLESQV